MQERMKRSMLFGKDVKINTWIDEKKNKNISKLYSSFDLGSRSNQQEERDQDITQSLKLEKVPSLSALFRMQDTQEITPDDFASNIFLQKKLDLRIKKNQHLEVPQSPTRLNQSMINSSNMPSSPSSVNSSKKHKTLKEFLKEEDANIREQTKKLSKFYESNKKMF